MYFSYLDLPSLPDDFKEKCYGNIKYIGVDPRLEKTNSERGIMNRATFLPIEVNEWLKENILIPVFGSIRPEQKNNLLNVTSYTTSPTGTSSLDGSHTQHVDRERHYALNYYFDAGGENTSIKWYSDFTKNGFLLYGSKSSGFSVFGVCGISHFAGVGPTWSSVDIILTP